MGRVAMPLQMDVTRKDEIATSIDEVIRRFGRLDVLVNNVGRGPGNPAELVNEADFDLTVAINLKGTFFACQAAGRQMIRQRSGRIINIGSQAGFVALPGEAIYCMTKAAISHLTKCLAVEWGTHNITVNAVAPTWIATPGTESALADPAFRADVLERIAGAAPDRQSHGRGGCGRLSGITRRLAHHRRNDPHRRRLDGAMRSADEPQRQRPAATISD